MIGAVDSQSFLQRAESKHFMSSLYNVQCESGAVIAVFQSFLKQEGSKQFVS